jgi:SAM-dependent methyltransferase
VSNAVISYPVQGNTHSFAVEDESFWFRHRNAIIAEALRQFPPGGTVYDIGGGNGFVAKGLEDAGFPAVLVEPGPAGAANARRRGLANVVCATVEAAGFDDHSLPAAGMFDVLEHIEDDAAFLRSLHRFLVPGGRLYLAVPAYNLLWAHDDVYAGHFRRYTRRSLAAVLQANGFRIEYASYFFWFLPLPIFLLRSLPSRLGWRSNPTLETVQKEHAHRKGFAHNLLQKAMAWEIGRIARRRAIPFGSSCLTVARAG